jgi:hypothetical protein
MCTARMANVPTHGTVDSFRPVGPHNMLRPPVSAPFPEGTAEVTAADNRRGGAAIGSPAPCPAGPLPAYIFPSVSSASLTCASVMLVVLGYFWMISR